jgi:hypothetical protein
MTRRKITLVVMGLVIVIGLPLFGKWVRQHQSLRCSLDGLPINMTYRVRMVNREGESRSFCCIRCARLWMDRQQDPPSAIFVTNETDGMEIDARSAYFVESRVTTNSITGNRIHAFREMTDAMNHRGTFRGELMTGKHHPFEPQAGSEK